MSERTVAKIVWSLVTVSFLAFIVFFIIKPGIDEKKSFYEDEYHGVISDIERRPGHRNIPHILLNGDWKLLNSNEAKMMDYILAGDSIVKSKGSYSIIIYRKDGSGETLRKEFK